jgi:hypothetical protein
MCNILQLCILSHFKICCALNANADKGLPPYRPANAISYILHRVRDISYV